MSCDLTGHVSLINKIGRPHQNCSMSLLRYSWGTRFRTVQLKYNLIGINQLFNCTHSSSTVLWSVKINSIFHNQYICYISVLYPRVWNQWWNDVKPVMKWIRLFLLFHFDYPTLENFIANPWWGHDQGSQILLRSISVIPDQGFAIKFSKVG
jgi:hypothetical protein